MQQVYARVPDSQLHTAVAMVGSRGDQKLRERLSCQVQALPCQQWLGAQSYLKQCTVFTQQQLYHNNIA
jgi:hypothetical protein